MNSLKRTLGVFCLTVIAFTLSGQVSKDHAYQAMDNLLGGKWKLSGHFMDGNKFEQEYSISKILKGTTYKVETFGNTAKTGKQHGLRNAGMRGWNAEKKTMEFVEADVFGGFITGEVTIEGMDILYTYEYAGQTMIDAWIYKGLDMYEFVVGTRNENGQWTDITINGGIARQK